jgi:hypothetical protein
VSSSLSVQVSGCSLADREALDGGLLLGEAQSGGVRLLHILGLLDAVELNVAVAGEVGADTTVGTVGSSATRDGSLHNDVVDHAVVNVQLGGLGVGSQVDEELTNALDRLLGPSTLGVLVHLALGVATDTTGIASERNNLLVLQDVLHVLDGFVEVQALAGAGDFVSVLVVSTQVTNLALSRYQTEQRNCHETD